MNPKNKTVKLARGKINKANANKALFYTRECQICGFNKDLQPYINEARQLGLDPVVRQTTLWQGWANEVAQLGLEQPCLFLPDFAVGATLTWLQEHSVAKLMELADE